MDKSGSKAFNRSITSVVVESVKILKIRIIFYYKFYFLITWIFYDPHFLSKIYQSNFVLPEKLPIENIPRRYNKKHHTKDTVCTIRYNSTGIFAEKLYLFHY